ncbi:Gas vesicle synthesis protein GvpL/GvpF [Streptomyces sp. DvalAA-14]|uniref:GvpL/GvpF family gas vesicle protein n=1 Tax=unclassified Streptomyces TaxID=2593676 RepID=UPI00081B01DC|nr:MULTISPECIES: GvpL/GvpF family gas vesicle protein [unclassified Streptomyces]MYS21151.1 gas vesicle protein [Streptomyces sp. SID4948]SCD85406.1 Gas vesicle synthesis protein GvpL/GvpF [Streptomyces sp. DvalAA-14]
MSLYVYGVIRAATALPAELRGVGQPPQPVRRLTAGKAAVVVSTAPDRLRATRRDLQAHQEVQLALCAAGPLLPTRFGVVAPDRDRLREQVSAAAADYLAALDRVAGHIEMNVKAAPVESGLASLVRDDPRVRQAREHSRRSPSMEADLRLGEAVVAGLRNRAETAAAAVRTALQALAADVRDGPQLAEYVLNASFLVPAGGAARFRSAARDLAREHAERAAVTVTGPLPCYSFADLPAPARA